MAKNKTREQVDKDAVDKLNQWVDEGKPNVGHGGAPLADATLNAALPDVEQAAQLPDSEQPSAQSNGSDRMANARANRKRVTPPAGEGKADKGRRLANNRVPKALKALLRVTALGNRQQYDFTDEQRRKIVSTFKDAVAAMERKFNGERIVADEFSL